MVQNSNILTFQFYSLNRLRLTVKFKIPQIHEVQETQKSGHTLKSRYRPHIWGCQKSECALQVVINLTKFMEE